MPERIVEFWFEFASTYSHIAAQRIETLARAAGVKVEWKPFLLGPVFQRQGWSDSPFNVYPAKGAYMWRDLQRECEKYGIPFRKPSRFPRNSLLAARVAVVLEPAVELSAFVRRVYIANFIEDSEIADPAVIGALLRSVGIDRADEVVAAASHTDIKERLRQRTDEAIQLGIFGAPTFFVDGEMYWGNDRLDDALAHCAATRRPAAIGER